MALRSAKEPLEGFWVIRGPCVVALQARRSHPRCDPYTGPAAPLRAGTGASLSRRTHSRWLSSADTEHRFHRKNPKSILTASRPRRALRMFMLRLRLLARPLPIKPRLG